MEEEQQKQADEQAPATISWREFLESYPLNSPQIITDYYTANKTGNDREYYPYRRVAPVLRLYCPACEGVRNYTGKWNSGETFRAFDILNAFLVYTCKDCEKATKTFCVQSIAVKDTTTGRAIKLGELPVYHVELPRSLKTLLKDDYRLFEKGLTCEKQGLGIAAFTYYRRVVESHKSQLISEILRVAEKLGLSQGVRDKLAMAAQEKQFARAVEAIKDAIPESLLVDGQNPLKLLHDALSIGVHGETDASCLRIAHGVRLVLADLSERLKLALEDQAELRAAVADVSRFIGEGRKKRPNNEQDT